MPNIPLWGKINNNINYNSNERLSKNTRNYHDIDTLEILGSGSIKVWCSCLRGGGIIKWPRASLSPGNHSVYFPRGRGSPHSHPTTSITLNPIKYQPPSYLIPFKYQPLFPLLLEPCRLLLPSYLNHNLVILLKSAYLNPLIIFIIFSNFKHFKIFLSHITIFLHLHHGLIIYI